jgi:hypothetical protein
MNNNIALFVKAFREILRYDVAVRLFGFRRIHHEIAGLAVHRPTRRADVKQICAAIEWATAFYWKPVHCLQRSVAMVRLLRRNGWEGRLVIGYRPVPFFSHAWVEINELPVADSPSYKMRLRVLETI